MAFRLPTSSSCAVRTARTIGSHGWWTGSHPASPPGRRVSRMSRGCHPPRGGDGTRRPCLLPAQRSEEPAGDPPDAGPRRRTGRGCRRSGPGSRSRALALVSPPLRGDVALLLIVHAGEAAVILTAPAALITAALAAAGAASLARSTLSLIARHPLSVGPPTRQPDQGFIPLVPSECFWTSECCDRDSVARVTRVYLVPQR